MSLKTRTIPFSSLPGTPNRSSVNMCWVTLCSVMALRAWIRLVCFFPNNVSRDNRMRISQVPLQFELHFRSCKDSGTISQVSGLPQSLSWKSWEAEAGVSCGLGTVYMDDTLGWWVSKLTDIRINWGLLGGPPPGNRFHWSHLGPGYGNSSRYSHVTQKCSWDGNPWQ